METSLNTLFEFQLILADMQSKIVEAMQRGIDREHLKPKIDLYDRIHKIYRDYDRMYFQAVYWRDAYTRQGVKLVNNYNEINLLNNKIKQIEEFYLAKT